tara:strand:+ start:316 stop:732 length:417 start_codon:yes stop_codon:yes gene_type:complete
MNDFSDLILLMGAMVAFAMLSSTTVRSFQGNNEIIVNAELEYRAISTGQAIIDEMRWITNENEFRSSSSSYYFRNFPVNRTISYGSTSQYSTEYTIDGESVLISSSNNLKKYLITISVKESSAKTTPINLEFVKSFEQ